MTWLGILHPLVGSLWKDGSRESPPVCRGGATVCVGKGNEGPGVWIELGEPVRARPDSGEEAGWPVRALEHWPDRWRGRGGDRPTARSAWEGGRLAGRRASLKRTRVIAERWGALRPTARRPSTAAPHLTPPERRARMVETFSHVVGSAEGLRLGEARRLREGCASPGWPGPRRACDRRRGLGLVPVRGPQPPHRNLDPVGQGQFEPERTLRSEGRRCVDHQPVCALVSRDPGGLRQSQSHDPQENGR